MRKLKTVTTQDHMIHIVESDSINDERTCVQDLQLQETLAVFHIEGAENHFTKSNPSADWVSVGAVSSPAWVFGKPNIIMGSVATTPTMKSIVFIPKTETAPMLVPGYVETSNIANLDRESFVELGFFADVKKVDPNTFEDIEVPIDDIVPDDVIIE